MSNNAMIGARIKERRLELGITQKELAKRVGYTSHTTIAKVESGSVDLPQSKIMAFADALDTSSQYILYGDTDNRKITYLDNDESEWLEHLRSDPELRMLLSASSKLNEDDIKYLIKLAERMNRE